jgi:hypothetical protein
MANIKTELSHNNLVSVTFAGRQARHLRLTDGWTDWMLAMDDFRDLIIPLTKEDTDLIITELLNNPNRLRFNNTNIGQEYNLNNGKKIVRRVGAGNTRDEYQSVAFFIKNTSRRWPPEPIEVSKNDILCLMRAMITLDCPANYCVTDSLRNLQYLLSILWVKKSNPSLLQGRKKPRANEIFRISLVK